MLPVTFFNVVPGSQVNENVGIIEPFNEDLYAIAKASYGIEPIFENEIFYLANNSVDPNYKRKLLELPIYPGIISAINGYIYKLGGFSPIDQMIDENNSNIEWFATAYDHINTLNYLTYEKKATHFGGLAHLWEFTTGNIVLGLDHENISVFITSHYNPQKNKPSLFKKIFGIS